MALQLCPSEIHDECRRLYRDALMKGHPAETLPEGAPQEARSWFNAVGEFAHLTEWTHDESICEILIHSATQIQIQGVSGRLDITIDGPTTDDWQLALEGLAQRHRATWNFASPFASFFCSLHGHSFRATLAHHGLRPSGPSKLFLRRLSSHTFPIEAFGGNGLNLLDAVSGKKNILISGGTGSGKTSLLRTLLSTTPNEDHILILEDTHELIDRRPNITSLLANESEPHKQLVDYCQYALRMKPDRMILGEIRGKEIAPFFLAMNTGHKGLMSSVHANSASDALSRLALLFSLHGPANSPIPYELALSLVCRNLDCVVHMENREIIEVVSVLGSEGGQAIVERTI